MIIDVFVSNTIIFYYLTDWQTVLVISTSSAHPYIKLKKKGYIVKILLKL